MIRFYGDRDRSLLLVVSIFTEQNSFFWIEIFVSVRIVVYDSGFRVHDLLVLLRWVIFFFPSALLRSSRVHVSISSRRRRDFYVASPTSFTTCVSLSLSLPSSCERNDMMSSPGVSILINVLSWNLGDVWFWGLAVSSREKLQDSLIPSFRGREENMSFLKGWCEIRISGDHSVLRSRREVVETERSQN